MNPSTCQKCGYGGGPNMTAVKKGFIYRRRECSKCGHRWSTYEIMSDEYKTMSKRSKLVVQLLSEVSDEN